MLVGVAASICGLAFGQSIPYLTSTSERPKPEADVKLALTRAKSDDVTHFFVISSAGRTNLDDFSDQALRFSAPGAIYTGCQFADVIVDAKGANGWLREFGMMSRITTEMTVTRSAATIFRVGEGGDGISASRAGLKTELRPLSDPTALNGGDIAFRFYGHGQEVVRGATIRATHFESKTTTEVTTGEAGVANLADVKPGTWRLVAFALEGAETGPHLSIATLTFQVPPRRTR